MTTPDRQKNSRAEVVTGICGARRSQDGWAVAIRLVHFEIMTATALLVGMLAAHVVSHASA